MSSAPPTPSSVGSTVFASTFVAVLAGAAEPWPLMSRPARPTLSDGAGGSLW